MCWYESYRLERLYQSIMKNDYLVLEEKEEDEKRKEH